MLRRTIALLVALVPLVAGLAGCGDDGDVLTVYSGRTENLVGPLLDRFAEEEGVDIEVRYADSADLALQIDQEGDRSPADVFLSQSPGALGYLAGNQRLAPLEDDVLDLVDEQYRSSEDLWVGLSARVRVLVYNTDELDEADLPDSVFDLTDEEYGGRVAVAPENGSFQDFVTAMRELEGEDVAQEWLDGMAANDPQGYANNTAIVEAVARGEVEMGLVNHYYAHRYLAEDPDAPIANHVFPDGDVGALLITTGAGLVEGTEQSDDAHRLITFLLGEEAQQFFSEETFEYPLASGVEPVADLPPLDSITTPRFDLNELGGGLEATTEMIRESGLDTA